MTICSINSSNPVLQIVSSNITSAVSVPVGPSDGQANIVPQQVNYTTFLNTTITPRSVNDILVIEFSTSFIRNTGAFAECVLFQDANANGLDATLIDTKYGAWKTFKLMHIMTAGTTSATTFKIALTSDQPPGHVNSDQSGTRLYGGTSSCILTVTEYAP